MNRLEDKHVVFLKQCADKPQKTHESDLPVEDLEQMVKESLLIKYGGVTNRYSISRYGTQYVKERISNGKDVGPVLPEMRAAAVKYVMSHGHDKQNAEALVDEWGVNYLLEAQAKEVRANQQVVGQRDIQIPRNEQGVPEIRFRKS